jgi:hypothetical protein
MTLPVKVAVPEGAEAGTDAFSAKQTEVANTTENNAKSTFFIFIYLQG